MKSNSGHQMTIRLVTQEPQTDHLVYRVYNITPEEIIIVKALK